MLAIIITFMSKARASSWLCKPSLNFVFLYCHFGWMKRHDIQISIFFQFSVLKIDLKRELKMRELNLTANVKQSPGEATNIFLNPELTTVITWPLTPAWGSLCLVLPGQAWAEVTVPSCLRQVSVSG